MAASMARPLTGIECDCEPDMTLQEGKDGSLWQGNKDMCSMADYTDSVAGSRDRALHAMDWRHDEANAVS